MKAEFERDEFIPFKFTLEVETHDEFKSLYKAMHDGGENLKNALEKLAQYSDANEVPV